MDTLRLHLIDNVLGIGCRADDDRHGIDLLGVDDDGTVLFEVFHIASRLDLLEGHDEIRFTVFDHGGVDLFAEADIGDDGTAALAHSVHFGYFYVVAFIDQQSAEQLGSEQRTLSADADDHNILSH